VRMPRTLRCAGLALVAAAHLALSPAASGASEQERQCPVPGSFSAFEPLVPRTARALAGGQAVVIVVLGGASSLGRAAGGASLSWPARMAGALTLRFPAARIKVMDLAAPRQTAQEAVARLARDVLPLKPTLVVWETGTMEAVRGVGVDEFRETLETGLDELLAVGIEVVLMTPQFSRDTDAVIRFDPYLVTMREMADLRDVPLFHRHGIMRYWAESGMMDLRARTSEGRRALAERLYECIGRAMADLVARDAAGPETPADPEGRR